MKSNSPEEILNSYQKKISKNRKTIFCYAYQEDLDSAYAFYCARYENITYDEFLHLGISDFSKKLSSIPKDEPLYEIIKARSIDIGKIKDKDEKKYWRELKRIHKIPPIYLSEMETNEMVRHSMQSFNMGGIKK